MRRPRGFAELTRASETINFKKGCRGHNLKKPLIIVAAFAYRKAVKTAKKVEELLNSSEAYEYAKKALENQSERQKVDAVKRAEMLRDLDKGDGNGKSV